MIVEKEHRLYDVACEFFQLMENNNWNNSSRDSTLTVLRGRNVQSIPSRSCNLICPRNYTLAINVSMSRRNFQLEDGPQRGLQSRSFT